jgi:hypothetical protein
MCDYDQLKVRLRLSGTDDAMQRFCETTYVIPIEICGRFVEGNELQFKVVLVKAY